MKHRVYVQTDRDRDTHPHTHTGSFFLPFITQSNEILSNCN